ncbi:MAG TPA: LssY C-terminal domain-containing protein [Oscillatoriaceae cyanobacterium]
MDIKSALSEAFHVVTAPVRLAGEAVDAGIHHFLPDQYTVSANLPKYTKLPAAALQAAEARSKKGATVRQPLIHSPQGDPCEPVTMYVTGTKAQLEAALEKQGWKKADKLTIWNGFKSDLTLLDKITGLNKIFSYKYDSSPMTVMSVDGKQQVEAFDKNDDYHTGRDHLRVFDTGKKDAQGRPVWAIAATRDTQIDIKVPSFGKGHHTDSNINPERDMIMADLLKSGVKDWTVAQGKMTPADQSHVDQTYQYDGKVYNVTLPNT